MNVTGIIAEYNPFHNGHFYQMAETSRLTGCDYLIVVMSGDYVQRGEPTVYDKYTRARMALNAGADLVLELPVSFATGSAEDFSSCAISLLDHLGVVNQLCFGSEHGDIGALMQAAALLNLEPEPYQKHLKLGLKAGQTYAKARAGAFLTAIRSGEPSCFSYLRQLSCSDWETILSSPNNILGIEYCRALLKRHSTIKPLTIPRLGADYHEESLEKSFASATGIRKLLLEHRQDRDFFPLPDRLLSLVPEFAAAQMTQAVALFPNDFSELLNYRLLTCNQEQKDLTDFCDVSPELAFRIKNQLLHFASFTERTSHLKTKQYTYTRLSRALLHILLGLTKEQQSDFRQMDYIGYARLLGFRKTAAPLLHQIKLHSDLPLITHTANARRTLSGLPLNQLLLDFHSSHLYQSVLYQRSGIQMPNEFTQSVILTPSTKDPQ